MYWCAETEKVRCNRLKDHLWLSYNFSRIPRLFLHENKCFREEASRHFLEQRNQWIFVNFYYAMRSIKSQTTVLPLILVAALTGGNVRMNEETDFTNNIFKYLHLQSIRPLSFYKGLMGHQFQNTSILRIWFLHPSPLNQYVMYNVLGIKWYITAGFL